MIKNLLKISLLVVLLSCSFSKSLESQETNNFAAWNDLGETYYNSKNHLCFKTDIVVIARLSIFDEFFTPHPYSNKFQDILLNSESLIANAEYWEDAYNKQKKKQKFFIILGASSGVILGILTSKTILYIKNK